MSAHVEVVSTDLRRVKVKVSPGTYLVDVLNEACKKLNLNSDKYELKHKQKLVDLSGPFRTSGLGPGAKLELVQKSKSASVVSIALDVNGQRYTKKLPSDMTLWKVMRQFETAEKNLNLTGRGVPVGTNSGQLYHEAPVVNIMGREYSALEDLQKTLSQCGISSGSIVLRVTFKLSERTLLEAMEDISRYLDDVEPEQKPSDAEGAPTTEPTPSAAPPIKEEALDDNKPTEAPTTLAQPTAATTSSPDAPPEPSTASGGHEPMDVDNPTPSTPPTSSDPLQPTSIFSAPSSSTPAAALRHEDDSVYEPTIVHAQLRQLHLQQRSQNTRLKSDAELAADAAADAARLARIAHIEVKVRFPDQTSAVWTVGPEETGRFLYDAVRASMRHPGQGFRLILPPSVGGGVKTAGGGGGAGTTLLEDERTLIAGYRLRGRELLHLLWEDGVPAEVRAEPFLKGAVASRAQEVVVPEIAGGGDDEEGGAGAGPSTAAAGKAAGKAEGGKSGGNLDSDAMKKKLSKFLGLKKK